MTFVVFLSSDHKITNTTDRLVAVFHLASQLTDTLAHQGIFSLMPNIPIIEPLEVLLPASMCVNDMVADTGGVYSGV